MAKLGFFERQERARRNTTLLILLFTAAVVLITLVVDLVGYLVTRDIDPSPHFGAWLTTRQGIFTSITVIAVIGLGSLIRWIDLAGGGERVARMVGARLLEPSSQDPDERRLRNVVEEMAIASGVPVPDLYVMDNETAINAFVAGYSPGEAVMVVTHGALTELNRDELQGVVGHEFSHILNTDMRINVRLIALLAGILMIGQIGQFLLGSGSRSRYHHSRDNRGQGVMVAVGLALTVVGYIGLFFGRLIQAAISRQREMLADASSVQFTRNPEGIASALYRIGESSSYFQSTSHASDMNHMCFGETVRMRFAGWLASHPPIDDRIRAIDPGLLARFRNRRRDDLKHAAQAPEQTSDGSLQDRLEAGLASLVGRRTAAVAPNTRLSDSAGAVTPANEEYAQQLLKRLPDNFRTLLYTRTGAAQFCYSLIFHGMTDAERDTAMQAGEATGTLAFQPELIERFYPTLDALGESIRLPALELAMPALRKLDPSERRLLEQILTGLVRADGRVTLFEFALLSFIRRHLLPEGRQADRVRYRRFGDVADSLGILLSLAARSATHTPDEAQACYSEAVAGFEDRTVNLGPMREKVSSKALVEALNRLRGLSPMLKPAVIDACGHCILRDNQVVVREYEILRLVADQLDCPMPPLPVSLG
ncbi:M48 family metallopeptidase [Marinobacter nanhaiticus D15-8W]|uniref:Peptidase M48 n=1 Tax=Marinobacter nanhaiticus D15-8W TaxID=626887 RepID=N6WZJ5_9GAMM|nr:M48 family metallopeptidase [Marinobacter nanhaiticus]ENO16991.1 peptidase M48 [Marinobacter nanhaiticus D15-8W]BES72013.1 M48 family metallopeptidase [Marinobacter nanhaiticus D15-8W]